MTTFFCPACFTEIDPAATRCPACGANVQAWRDRSYAERLLQALHHPLADVRMVAIDTLGRLRVPDAAAALADCAMRHPHDPVQGVAILRTLEQQPRDPAWTAAMRTLCDHPVAAVARDATRALAPAPPRAPATAAAGFRALIDDYANHADATEALAALGGAAIAPLRRYLDEGPQVNPHGRLFAVDMLARLSSAEATEGLRRVLRGTRLHDLPANRHEAEYQVKDATLRHLTARDYSDRDDDIAYALRSERLPAAVAAVGARGLSVLASELAQLLDDDVLAQAASDALVQLGEAGSAALQSALPTLFAGERDNLRARLALLRALLALWRLHTAPAPALLDAAAAAHPFVTAASALFQPPNGSHARQLLLGAVSSLPTLPDACRQRLDAPDYAPWRAAAAVALRDHPQQPDLYGNLHPLPREACRWLERLAAATAADAGPPERPRHDADDPLLPPRKADSRR